MTSYAVAGRVYLGAITALSVASSVVTVTGGTELRGVRGQHVRARFGMRIEVLKDDRWHDTMLVEDVSEYPRVLIPFGGALRADLDVVRAPLKNASFKAKRQAMEGLIRLPSTGLLVVPDDPAKDDYLYLPAAKLGPESSDLLNFHEVEPTSIEFVEYVPAKPAYGTDDMVQGTLAEISAAIAASQAPGGGGGET